MLRIRDPVARLVVWSGVISIGSLLLADAVGWMILRRWFKVVPAEVLAEFRSHWLPLEGFVILIGSAVFAVCRAGFHPAHDKGYRNWLKLTPWRPGQALPLGSPTLRWIDVALLSAWALFVRFHAHGNWLLPPIVALTAYTFASLAAMATARRWEGLVLCWGLPAMLIPGFDAPQLAAIAGAMYLLAWRGITQGLRTFPWESEPVWHKHLATWPWSRIGPNTIEPTPRRKFAGACLLISATLGWCVACILARIGSRAEAADMRRGVFQVCATAAIALPVARWAFYRIGCRPPINFWGRIVKGRWIIPAFDRIYVAPLLLLFTLGAVLVALKLSGLPPPAMAGLFCTAALTATFTLPPSMRDWRHTGQFHVVRFGTVDSQTPIRKSRAA
jgi:hypothetical protein